MNPVAKPGLECVDALNDLEDKFPDGVDAHCVVGWDDGREYRVRYHGTGNMLQVNGWIEKAFSVDHAFVIPMERGWTAENVEILASAAPTLLRVAKREVKRRKEEDKQKNREKARVDKRAAAILRASFSRAGRGVP